MIRRGRSDHALCKNKYRRINLFLDLCDLAECIKVIMGYIGLGMGRLRLV